MDTENQYKQKNLVVLGGGLSGVGAAILAKVKGMNVFLSDMDQLCDNLGYMENFEPLTEAERALLPEAVNIIYSDIAVACTGCRYCVDGCPKNIEIPKYFELYNAEMHSENKDFSTHEVYYENLTKTYGKASDCIRCRQCERICPQHIRIVEALKKVAEVFEDN